MRNVGPMPGSATPAYDCSICLHDIRGRGCALGTPLISTSKAGQVRCLDRFPIPAEAIPTNKREKGNRNSECLTATVKQPKT